MGKWFILFITLIVINLAYLNWKVFFFDTQTQEAITASPDEQSTQKTTTNVTNTENICTPACLSAIKQATATAQTTTITKNVQTGSNVKEFFIPFGSGTSSSPQWTNVGGLQAYINTASYPNIKQVTFEASVYVPTGNETVNVQLYNMTGNHTVWNSQVFFDGGTTPELLISQPITLDPGNNLYQVQMQTQLTYPAVLGEARVHIITY